MLPLDVLLVLFTAGVWVYCLIDVIMTPPTELRSLTTMSWAVLVTVLPVIGAVAWLLVGRPARGWRAPMVPRHLAGSSRISPQEAIRRHPSGRATEPGASAPAQGQPMWPAADGNRPVGPDDDPEFLRELDRRLRGSQEPDSDF
jgi:Phospholipase_D-nuclease N-terminal